MTLRADSASTFHNQLNSVNNHIQFTEEKVKGRFLPFLNIYLTRDSDGDLCLLKIDA